MTKTEELTERYVFAVVRDTPEQARADIATELRSTIADMVEANVASGMDAATAEREALLALGAPSALAVGYSKRPLYLVGPRYFHLWKRVLINTLMWVTPLVAVLIVLVDVVEKSIDPIGIFASAVGSAFTVALHICFWVTLSFAIVDRFTADDETEKWSLDQLPTMPVQQVSISKSDAIAGAVFSLVLALLLVLQSRYLWIRSSEPVPLLNNDLWSFWLPWLVGVCIFSAIVELWKYRSGWTVATVSAAIVASVAFSAPVAYLALEHRLLSEEFIAQVNMGASGLEITTNFIVVGAVAVALWEIGEAVFGFWNKQDRHSYVRA